ncbi:uncharacterized protein LOC115629369 [Scaptodrosophila lebanonensis]|uniref:Uncharacterized protein LOC115629369 n=1 Tax=Drosophila lebanonensis TaxID=7225 RepID=A0A6J2U3H9_DROLE|nr:uncharacterized protein LOC115629369 [Scaptodrosophila lebanonensis]
MGRTVKIKRKPRTMRPTTWFEESEEYNLITVEELAESVRRWSFDKERMVESKEKSEPLDNSDGKYGVWIIPADAVDPSTRALDLMRALRDVPHPDIFRPPIKLSGEAFTFCVPFLWTGRKPWLQTQRKIFEDALPIIKKRAQEAQERIAGAAGGGDESCEGAVGYDRRFYNCGMLVRPMTKRFHHYPNMETTTEETTWMGGKYCATITIEMPQKPINYLRLRKLRKKLRPIPFEQSKLSAGIRRVPKKRTERRVSRPKAKFEPNEMLDFMCGGISFGLSGGGLDEDYIDIDEHAFEEEDLLDGIEVDDYDDYFKESLDRPKMKSWRRTTDVSELVSVYGTTPPIPSTSASPSPLPSPSTLPAIPPPSVEKYVPPQLRQARASFKARAQAQMQEEAKWFLEHTSKMKVDKNDMPPMLQRAKELGILRSPPPTLSRYPTYHDLSPKSSDAKEA